MTTPVRALFERLLAGADADAAHAEELRNALDVYGAAGDPESVAEFVAFALDGEHFGACEEEGEAFDAEIARREAFTAWFRELCVRAGLPVE